MNWRAAAAAAAGIVAGVLLAAARPSAQTIAVSANGAPTPRLEPTAHAPVPSDLNAFWFAPARGAALSPALTGFVKGVRLLDEENKP